MSLVSLDLETGSKHQLRIHSSKVLNGEETPLFSPSLLQSYVRTFNALCYISTHSWRHAVFGKSPPLPARFWHSTRFIPSRIPGLLPRKSIVSPYSVSLPRHRQSFILA